MRKLLMLLAVLFMLIGNLDAATYCLRNNGTAGSKTVATDCLTVSNCMNETVHNSQTFVGGDVILVCPDDGNFNSQVTTPSNGGSGTEIRYAGQYSSTYGWPVFDEGFKIASNYNIVYGIEIRPGVAESGTKTFEGGRFANTSRSWQAAEETAVGWWDSSNLGIFAVGIGATGGGLSVTPQLYWRNKSDTGSFAAVGGSGEVKYTAATVLTDNDNVIEAETGVSSGKAYETCLQCEQEDSHQASTSTSLDADEWAELQVGLDFSGGLHNHEYAFSLYESSTQIGSESASTVKLYHCTGDFSSGDVESFEESEGSFCTTDWTETDNSDCSGGSSPCVYTYITWELSVGPHIGRLVLDDAADGTSNIEADLGSGQSDIYLRTYFKLGTSNIDSGNYAYNLPAFLGTDHSTSYARVSFGNGSGSNTGVYLWTSQAGQSTDYFEINQGTSYYYQVHFNQNGTSTLRFYNSSKVQMDTHNLNSEITLATQDFPVRYIRFRNQITYDNSIPIFNIDDLKMSTSTWVGLDDV